MCVCVCTKMCVTAVARGGVGCMCVYFILYLHVVSVFEGVVSVFLRVWAHAWVCWRECGLVGICVVVTVCVFVWLCCVRVCMSVCM